MKLNNLIKSDQLILTKLSGLIPLGSAVEGDEIWTRVGWRPILKIDKLLSPTVKVETKRYYSLCAAPETGIFQTIRDPYSSKMFEIAELRHMTRNWTGVMLGDSFIGKSIEMKSVPFVRKLAGNKKYGPMEPNVKFPTFVDQRLAWLLGNIWGDGCMLDNNRQLSKISMASSWDWPEIENQYITFVKEIFNYDCCVLPSSGACNAVSIHSKNLLKWLLTNDFEKSYSTSITVPNRILTSTPDLQMAFIAGFLDADGSVQHKTHRSIELNTTSLIFAKTLQLMLVANRIDSSIFYDDAAGYGSEENHPIYKVRINGSVSHILIHSLIDAWSPKLRTHEAAKWDKTLTAYNRKSLNLHTWINRAIGIAPHCGRYINLREFLGHSNYLGKEPFGAPIIQEQIKSISAASVEDCVSLTVGGQDFFWCNGLPIKSNDL